VLGITQAELNEITAGVTQIGANVMSNIIIAAPISNPINSNVLTLINNGTISEGAFGSLNAANLRIGSTGPVTLNNPNNDIAVLAANTTNGLTVNDGTNNLTVGTVDGDTGIVTTNSATSLTADNMNIQQQVNAGAGIVTLASFSANQQILLGGNDAATTLGLTDAELGQITASVLRVDDISGIIGVSGGAITRHAGYNTLSLATRNIVQSAALSVANLALSSGGGISLTKSSNSVDTLAFSNASGTVTFTNGASALTIGAVDGIASSSNAGGTTAISTGANLTFATGLYPAGTATLTSTGGAILDGDNGADVDVTAPTPVLSASTGIEPPPHRFRLKPTRSTR
jgi:hypothetical protein